MQPRAMGKTAGPVAPRLRSGNVQLPIVVISFSLHGRTDGRATANGVVREERIENEVDYEASIPGLKIETWGTHIGRGFN
jgi:hypothetical protein